MVHFMEPHVKVYSISGCEDRFFNHVRLHGYEITDASFSPFPPVDVDCRRIVGHGMTHADVYEGTLYVYLNAAGTSSFDQLMEHF